MENSTAKHTLASLRLASGHSQASLAAAMGTQQSYIARLERNGGDMQSSTIRRMADALGVTCDQIIDAIEDNETE
ncbi:helix-turn-helix domain-containing protein [Castellaniella daejeonensis]